MTISVQRILLIAAGAALGANARYLVGLWMAHRMGPGATFPYGTLFVNLTGSLILGFLVAWGARGGVNAQLRLFFGVGFLGAYTTFSSFSVESIQLWRTGQQGHSLFNLLLNNGIGLLCAWLGLVLGALLAYRIS